MTNKNPRRRTRQNTEVATEVASKEKEVASLRHTKSLNTKLKPLTMKDHPTTVATALTSGSKAQETNQLGEVEETRVMGIEILIAKAIETSSKRKGMNNLIVDREIQGLIKGTEVEAVETQTEESTWLSREVIILTSENNHRMNTSTTLDSKTPNKRDQAMLAKQISASKLDNKGFPSRETQTPTPEEWEWFIAIMGADAIKYILA